jgi:hypothetical protein
MKTSLQSVRLNLVEMPFLYGDTFETRRGSLW